MPPDELEEAAAGDLFESSAPGAPAPRGIRPGWVRKYTAWRAWWAPAEGLSAGVRPVSGPPRRGCWCRSRAGAESPASRFLRARRFDRLVNLPGSELVRPLPLRFFANRLQHFRLGGCKPNVVADAEQHRFGRAALHDNERAVLIFRPAQQLAETGAGAQRRYHDGVIPVGPHGNSSFQLSELYRRCATASSRTSLRSVTTRQGLGGRAGRAGAGRAGTDGTCPCVLVDGTANVPSVPGRAPVPAAPRRARPARFSPKLASDICP